MGEVYVWNDMGAGNWEAPGGKGKFDIETGWAQKVVERYAPTYLSSPSQVLLWNLVETAVHNDECDQNAHWIRN